MYGIDAKWVAVPLKNTPYFQKWESMLLSALPLPNGQNCMTVLKGELINHNSDYVMFFSRQLLESLAFLETLLLDSYFLVGK